MQMPITRKKRLPLVVKPTVFQYFQYRTIVKDEERFRRKGIIIPIMLTILSLTCLFAVCLLSRSLCGSLISQFSIPQLTLMYLAITCFLLYASIEALRRNKEFTQELLLMYGSKVNKATINHLLLIDEEQSDS